MRQEPPEQLLELVQRTGLATAGQVRGVRRRARRLARGLPLFESVWVDALTQARIITRFQAAQIHAGQGESLRLGPYLLERRLRSAGYADCYRVREVESGGEFRLAVIEDCNNRPDDLLGRLETLVAQSGGLVSGNLSPLVRAGRSDSRVWAACVRRAGRSAADWMVHNGRFPPQAVLEIARQMLSGLVELERAGFCHGDICSLGLTLTAKGWVVLSPPGLRGIVRPEEGYGLADLAPEFYDYLAPERVETGAGPTVGSDIYSAGCLCWHLLTGRSPVPGGSSLAKLRGHQTMDIPDVRQLAPDTSPRLAAAIATCCQRDPGLRPPSMVGLARMLGASVGSTRAGLARCVTRGGPSAVHTGVSVAAIRRSKKSVLPMVVTAGSVIVAVAMLWSSWRDKGPQSATISPPQQPPASRPQAETPGALGTGNQTLAALPSKEQSDRRPIVGPPDGSFPTPSPTVLPAGYDAVPARTMPDPRRTDPKLLVLSTKSPTRGESLQLSAGQEVRGGAGGRPVIEVSLHGLVVRPENVRFENVDFVWKADSKQPAAGNGRAMIRLEASRAQFHRCSFGPAEPESGRVAAIRWTHPVERNELDLPHGQIVIADCVFQGVEAAVACETAGAVSLEFSNVLHLAGGPLVWLDHAPLQDEPVGIGLTNVLLRESGPVVECTFTQIAARPGNISIRANGSAFVISPGNTLLSFSGPESPGRLLSILYWSGQGSLVSPRTVIAGWRRVDGRVEVLDDAAVSMAGLVRSKVGFAGSVKEGPAGSRIVEWQVPLRTSDPPGIDPRNLSWRPGA